MSEFLARMAAGSLRRAAAARHRVPEQELLTAAGGRARPPLRLDRRHFEVIAEVKPESPSSGRLLPRGRGAREVLADLARSPDHARPCALSVLTEPDAFGGSLALLDVAAETAVATPRMRKDFLVDPYQVVEAAAHGASGVLVIVRMTAGERAATMLAAAAELSMFVLLEAFDRDDLDRAAELAAAAAGTVLVGVNARDLDTLRVDPGRTEALAAGLPEGVPAVAESGILTGADAARAAALGYDAVLVGEAVTRAPDPAAVVRALLAAGRGVAALLEKRP